MGHRTETQTTFEMFLLFLYDVTNAFITTPPPQNKRVCSRAQITQKSADARREDILGWAFGFRILAGEATAKVVYCLIF